MDSLLDTLDRARVRKAVEQAETRTAGEIVPVVVPRSDTYEVATWRGAGIGLLIGLVAVWGTVQVYTGWGLGWLFSPWGIASVALGAGTVGGLLAAYVPPLRRLVIGGELLDETVHRRALQAFVEEEVFATRDRTGILLFVSLFEHRVEVVGDAGINRHVDPDDWVEVIERIRKGIRNDNLTRGLEEAVEKCGRLLERRGIESGPDDENEIPNVVRTPSSPEDTTKEDGADPDHG